MLYYAAEKTDGVRYMLLILGSQGAFMVDRNFGMKRLPAMHFPSRQSSETPLDNTVLDGELVIDEPRGGAPPGQSEPRLRFLAYDSCSVSGKALLDEPLPIRLMQLRREVLNPRYASAMDMSSEPFTIEMKDFFSLQQLPHIFANVSAGSKHSKNLYNFVDPLRQLQHGNDGIIFTPVLESYQPGTCQTLLKWKPSNMNSIDFKLSRQWRGQECRFRLNSAHKGSLMGYDWITFSDEDYERFSNDMHADSRVVECVYDPNWVTYTYPSKEGDQNWDNPVLRKGGWKFERIREDKKLPNDFSVVKSIEISVRDGVTGPQLLQSLQLGVAGAAGSALFMEDAHE